MHSPASTFAAGQHWEFPEKWRPQPRVGTVRVLDSITGNNSRTVQHIQPKNPSTSQCVQPKTLMHSESTCSKAGILAL